MPDAADTPPVEPTDAAQDAAEAGIREIIEKLRDRGKDSRKAATVMLWSLVFTVLVGILFYVAAPLFEQVVNTRTAALRETATQLDTQLQEQNAARFALRDQIRPHLELTAIDILDFQDTSRPLRAIFRGAVKAEDGSALIYGTLFNIPLPATPLLRINTSLDVVTSVETGVMAEFRGSTLALY